MEAAAVVPTVPMTECTGGGRSRFPTSHPISYSLETVAVDPNLSATNARMQVAHMDRTVRRQVFLRARG